jgi:hypothetical protein
LREGGISGRGQKDLLEAEPEQRERLRVRAKPWISLHSPGNLAASLHYLGGNARLRVDCGLGDCEARVLANPLHAVKVASAPEEELILGVPHRSLLDLEELPEGDCRARDVAEGVARDADDGEGAGGAAEERDRVVVVCS